MALNTDEQKEVVGILQQVEVDHREMAQKFRTKPDAKDHPELTAGWVADIEGRAARVRELWTKMERA